MEVFRFIILGAVQGLTEFLPISSSGHLVIFQQILPGLDQPGIILEAFLHAGTLLSVVYFYKNSISKKSINYWILIGVSTIPAVLVGLLLNDLIEGLFSNVKIVGFALMVTGVINYATSKITKKGNKLKPLKNFGQLNFIRPFIIGLIQAFAIIPGISRSGSTIFAGRKMGLSRKAAAEFSFLMSIPVILGANIFEFLGGSADVSQVNHLYLAGFFTSFISGVFAIRVVLRFLEEANYKYFTYYGLIVGLLVIILF